MSSGSTAKAIVDSCKSKWIVRTSESAGQDYGLFLADENTWCPGEMFVFTFSERTDIQFRKLAAPAAAPGAAATLSGSANHQQQGNACAAGTTGGTVPPPLGSLSSVTTTSTTSLLGISASAGASVASSIPASVGSPVASPAPPSVSVSPPPSVVSPSATLTEKEKKARRERIDKEVTLFLQRRPPNSSSGTIRPEKADKKKPEKPIECFLNYDVIDHCFSVLEKGNMLTLEGIYRISGNSDVVRHLWAAYCLGHFDYLDWQTDIGDRAHVITGACKLYLRELETPLIPFDMHTRFLECEAMTDVNAKVATVAQLIGELNAVSQHTLRRIMYHLADVSTHEKVNLMPPENLAIVFGPTIMRPQVQDLAEMLNNNKKVDLCTFMIVHREKLFDLGALKAMTDRLLGPMPDLGLPEPKKSATTRKGKLPFGAGAASASPSPPAGAAGSEEGAAGAAAGKDGKKLAAPAAASPGPAGKKGSGVGPRKAGGAQRGYGDALQAMTADLPAEIIAGSMVFLRHMEVDPKGFRKHLKSVPPDQLIDILHNLAKHMAMGTVALERPQAKTVSVEEAKKMNVVVKVPVPTLAPTPSDTSSPVSPHKRNATPPRAPSVSPGRGVKQGDEDGFPGIVMRTVDEKVSPGRASGAASPAPVPAIATSPAPEVGGGAFPGIAAHATVIDDADVRKIPCSECKALFEENFTLGNTYYLLTSLGETTNRFICAQCVAKIRQRIELERKSSRAEEVAAADDADGPPPSRPPPTRPPRSPVLEDTVPAAGSEQVEEQEEEEGGGGGEAVVAAGEEAYEGGEWQEEEGYEEEGYEGAEEAAAEQVEEEEEEREERSSHEHETHEEEPEAEPAQPEEEDDDGTHAVVAVSDDGAEAAASVVLGGASVEVAGVASVVDQVEDMAVAVEEEEEEDEQQHEDAGGEREPAAVAVVATQESAAEEPKQETPAEAAAVASAAPVDLAPVESSKADFVEPDADAAVVVVEEPDEEPTGAPSAVVAAIEKMVAPATQEEEAKVDNSEKKSGREDSDSDDAFVE